MKLAQKCFRHTKEQGQARLPNRELITVQVVIAAGTAFNIKAIGDSPGVSRSGRWARARLFSGDDTLFTAQRVFNRRAKPRGSSNPR